MIDKEKAKRARAELQLRLGRASLMGFIMYTFKDYKMGWVHEEICFKLDKFLKDVLAGKSPRLMLAMPPRSGKTEIVSKRFPAYALGLHENLSIIAASYSAALSNRNNTAVQRIIDSQPYRELFPATLLPQPGIKSAKRRTNQLFELVNGNGSYRSTGVSGGITGMGASIIIIDDPIKDRAEADSEVTRRNIYDWYTSTAYTRLDPGGGVLLIMTRWHTDDLCGRLLNNALTGGEQWEVIEYPAIAEHDEAHRKKGEALHPERYNIEHLLQTKKTVGSRDWQAMYQQHPVAEGGNIFRQEWLKHYNITPPRFDQMAISWDMTFKDGASTDFCVGQVWGKLGADCYLIDQVRGHMSFTETLDAFVALARKYPKATLKLVEDKANGPAIIDTLKHEVHGIVAVNPEGSKTARAYAVTPIFESGNVYLPANAEWLPDYEIEMLQFPTGAHDDQVDATTQALRELTKRQKLMFNSANLLRRVV